MTSKISLEKLILKAASKEKSEEPARSNEPEPDLSLDLAEHQLYFEVERLEQQLKETQDTHVLRLNYANRIFVLVCVWLACVVTSLFLSGSQVIEFNLSDKVLITFITSTTVTVVGLFIVVAKWMFPNNNENSDKK